MKILLKTLVLVVAVAVSENTNTREQLGILCHSENIWREARGEPVLGQELVYWVVHNRGLDPCETIWKPYQFSWTKNWNRVYRHDQQTVNLVVRLQNQHNPYPNIKHYHNVHVNPSWNKRLGKSFLVGNHVFYYDK